jgi:acyl-[acyl-carrier-protein]-phospholipid O-acyltransferase/long-chain-fatty-acid--[acyl-carrier-protein] ligase
MRVSAALAIVITSLITLSYYQGWFEIAFGLTLLLAIQSTIYSPAKYGFARVIAGEQRLIAANGFIQAVTIIAILTGLFIFTLLFEWLLIGQSFDSPDTLLKCVAPLGWLLITLSVIEWLSTYRLPQDTPPSSPIHFKWRAYVKGKTCQQNLNDFMKYRTILYASLALAGFWAVSQTLLATFPAFAKMVMNEHNTIIIQGLLACSGMGIVMGALIAGRHEDESPTIIVIGVVGMLMMLIILPFLSDTLSFAATIIGFGLFGGLFIVPLNAHIQRTAPLSKLGTLLAANNWVHNLIMLSALSATYLAAQAEVSSQTLLFSLPIITTGWFLYVILLSKTYRKS